MPLVSWILQFFFSKRRKEIFVICQNRQFIFVIVWNIRYLFHAPLSSVELYVCAVLNITVSLLNFFCTIVFCRVACVCRVKYYSLLIQCFLYFYRLVSSETRFPRIEEMSHFHYNNVEFPGKLRVNSFCLKFILELLQVFNFL